MEGIGREQGNMGSARRSLAIRIPPTRIQRQVSDKDVTGLGRREYYTLHGTLDD